MLSLEETLKAVILSTYLAAGTCNGKDDSFKTSRRTKYPQWNLDCINKHSAKVNNNKHSAKVYNNKHSTKVNNIDRTNAEQKVVKSDN